MSTLHKVKAYFGMAPMDDYEDDYYEDDERGPARSYRRPREDRFDDEGYTRGYDDLPEGRRVRHLAPFYFNLRGEMRDVKLGRASLSFRVPVDDEG